MDRAILSRYEVVVSSVVDREINRQATGVDEGHATGLLLGDSASIHIFLVRVCFAL